MWIEKEKIIARSEIMKRMFIFVFPVEGLEIGIVDYKDVLMPL